MADHSDFQGMLGCVLKLIFISCIFVSSDYEKIFALLEEVQGPSEVQKTFIEFTIKEAAR